MASDAETPQEASDWSGVPSNDCPVPASAATWPGVPDGASGDPLAMGRDHCRCEVEIVNPMGLHARPAMLFVELANQFDCQVVLEKIGRQRDRQPVDGKSILQLLSLSAEKGTRLALETRGPAADAALLALSRLVASGFEGIPPS